MRNFAYLTLVRQAPHARPQDLDGDIGAVGRLSVQPDSASSRIRLDLKGIVYEGDVVPCASFWLVKIKDEEARVEAVISSCLDMDWYVCGGPLT